jgi:hypothetical protein
MRFLIVMAIHHTGKIPSVMDYYSKVPFKLAKLNQGSGVVRDHAAFQAICNKRARAGASETM